MGMIFKDMLYGIKVYVDILSSRYMNQTN